MKNIRRNELIENKEIVIESALRELKSRYHDGKKICDGWTCWNFEDIIKNEEIEKNFVWNENGKIKKNYMWFIQETDNGSYYLCYDIVKNDFWVELE